MSIPWWSFLPLAVLVAALIVLRTTTMTRCS